MNPKLKEKVKELCDDFVGDEKLGAKVVIEALDAPIKQILENAGKEPFVIIEKIKEKGTGFGYDALNSEYVNMKDAGIIDPAKVTRSALQNAASIASMIITTEVICVDKAEEINTPNEI